MLFQVQPLAYDFQSFIAEIRDGLNILKRDISQTNNKLNNLNLNCPSGNCLTTTVFLILATIQIVILTSLGENDSVKLITKFGSPPILWIHIVHQNVIKLI